MVHCVRVNAQRVLKVFWVQVPVYNVDEGFSPEQNLVKHILMAFPDPVNLLLACLLT
jgi:hypothetical protein